MRNSSKIKVTIIFVLAIFALLLAFTSCKGESLPKSNIGAKDAWDFVSAGFNKTSDATSYKVVFETHSEAAFGEFSSKDSTKNTMTICGLGTDDFMATAEKHNSETIITNEYFFTPDKFYTVEKNSDTVSMPCLYVSDNIDVVEEVTGLNVFEIEMDAVKKAIENSKSIVKETEKDLSYIRFSITSDELVSVLGSSYEVFNDMKSFSGFMFFYVNSDGYLVKFGYDSSYSETYEEQETYVNLKVEYAFSDINSVKLVSEPQWVSTLKPEAYDTVKYVKNNVEYFFLCERPDKGSDYSYKLYEITNLEDKEAPVKFAEIPETIEGVPVTAISGTAIAFGKGVETLVMPKYIKEVPYPENSTPMTVFCKCSELLDVPPTEVTVYLADEWEYVNGVPTVK